MKAKHGALAVAAFESALDELINQCLTKENKDDLIFLLKTAAEQINKGTYDS